MLAVNPGGSQQKITEKMTKAMDNFSKTNYTGVTITWNLVQYNLKCCGVEDSNDWTNSAYQKVPDSCYKVS